MLFFEISIYLFFNGCIYSLFEYIQSNRQEYNILKVLQHACEKLTEMIGEYITVLGSEGEA